MSAATVPGPSLRDIHLPDAPGWWPPAPGWWLLLALAVVLLVLAWRAWRRRRGRAALLQALDAQVAQALAHHAHDGAALAAEFSQLLRRAARVRDTRAAALQGDAWLQWLDQDDPRRPFSTGPGRLLLEAPFRSRSPHAEVAALEPLVRARVQALAGPTAVRPRTGGAAPW